MIRKALIFLILISSLHSASMKISLIDFIELFKTADNKNFLLNEKIEKENIYFIINDNVSSFSVNELEKMLKTKSLKLYKFKDYYYIDYKNADFDNELKLRSIKLKNNSYDEVKKIIELFNYDLSSSNNKNMQTVSNAVKLVDYISTTNTVIFLARDDDYKILEKEILKSDEMNKSALIKITISETNLNDLNKKGVSYKYLTNVFDSKTLKAYLNIFNASNDSNTFTNKTFYSFIDFLSEKNITNIKASPFLTIKNNIETSFSIVENIPYLSKSETYNDTNKRESNSYSYKDVGLKINIKPTILKNKIELDLSISIEDILDNTSLTPKTSKKYLKGSYVINKNEILVLSGINKETEFENSIGIPVLKEIPVIKYLFTLNYKSKVKNSLLITIEYIDDKKDNFDFYFQETLKELGV